MNEDLHNIGKLEQLEGDGNAEIRIHSNLSLTTIALGDKQNWQDTQGTEEQVGIGDQA